METQTFHVPEKATKQLNFHTNKTSGHRKLVISTNWLRLFGFNPKDKVIEKSLGKDKGIIVERVFEHSELESKQRTKKVYERSYSRRKNNCLESQLDIRSQQLLNNSFPENCIRVHITFLSGKVIITPITLHQQKAIKNAESTPDKLSAFCACTSGVDLMSLVKNNFSIHSVLEWRPNEKKDKRDLTETGALNITANIPIVNSLYNEDISQIDIHSIASQLRDNPFTLFHASPQCDEFSTLKNKSSREKSISDLSSSMDMSYDMLRIVDELAPPTVLFENVTGWIKSAAFNLLSLRLRRWGYTEHILVGDARDYGGLTSRKRAYVFYTALPVPFSFMHKTSTRENDIWKIVEPYLEECRDVTHSRSLQKGLETGRLRTISRGALSSPTPVKSQERMAKDSVCIKHNGKLFWPTESLLKRLLSIPEEFDLRSGSKVIASEIIGQSIDFPFHDAIIKSIRKHLDSYYKLNSKENIVLAT